MAKVTEASDSENERVANGKEDETAEEQNEEDAEVSDEEYEIEAIVKHASGMFPEGREGYFVKWKNYGHEHNSWVDEQDAGNAADLIAAFWQRQKKEKRASVAKGEAKPRKSTGAARASSERASSSAPKKRKAKSAKEDSDVEMDQEEEAEKPRKKGKVTSSRRSVGAKTQTKAKADASSDDEAEEFGNMKAYVGIPTWEHLVQSVDTVERTDDNALVVYFTLTSGVRVRESSETCAERFPQKMIKFYESNLRWKQIDSADESQK
ncbi:hypothetical protein PLICRDRAFT_163314 [Plicaturopsis crispa FD-325 SS-3]|nr:hypothetical protein PLICRDRAFT_163314 [Plicaturopsis crispa FD-325 SS-3]